MKCKIIVFCLVFVVVILAMLQTVLSFFAFPFLMLDKILGSGVVYDRAKNDYWDEDIGVFYKLFKEITEKCERSKQ